MPEKKGPEGGEVQAKAFAFLRQQGISALVVIGGDGSQTGSFALAKKGFPVVGIASTIDNDLYGSDVSIGVDTALNVALEGIDRIKVTASSHKQAFLVGVMGRHCGYLALVSGLAGGAECVVLPEVETDPEFVACELWQAYERGKSHAIVVVAEGAKYNAEELSSYFKEHREQVGFELRIVKLGYVQRGGTPGRVRSVAGHANGRRRDGSYCSRGVRCPRRTHRGPDVSQSLSGHRWQGQSARS